MKSCKNSKKKKKVEEVNAVSVLGPHQKRAGGIENVIVTFFCKLVNTRRWEGRKIRCNSAGFSTPLKFEDFDPKKKKKKKKKTPLEEEVSPAISWHGVRR